MTGGGRSTRPRVLVVEDDPSLRDFVGMSLEEVDADVVLAAGVDEALQALAQGPVDVVLTDLALGERSGLELLDRLLPADAPPAACVVVFSGGVDDPAEDALRARGVWRVIRKPAPVAALEAVVRGALAHGAAADPPASAPTAPSPSGARVRGPVSAVDEARLVDTWFAGERALYEQFLVSCRPRLAAAIDEGDAAAQAQDVAGLGALCHRLKTLLRMLGAESDARLAAAVEVAMQADRAGGLALWQALRRRLAARAEGDVRPR